MSNIRFKNCPCCNSLDFTMWWETQTPNRVRDWKEFFYGGRQFIRDIYSCCSCGYRFINTISQDSEKWYSLQDIDVYRSIGMLRKHYFEDIKRGIINRFSKALPVDAAVLDLACGDGLWLDLWRGSMSLFGTEACDDFRGVLSEKKITILAEKEFRIEGYNLLSMFNFLEHIEEPDIFIFDKWKFVKPGGLLIIEVPDMGKMAAFILGTRYYLISPMHYSYFDRCSLGRLLTKTCHDGSIAIYTSPSLKTDLNGMLKWVGIKRPIPNFLNFRLPIGYAASIIAVVKKASQT